MSSVDGNRSQFIAFVRGEMASTKLNWLFNAYLEYVGALNLFNSRALSDRRRETNLYEVDRAYWSPLSQFWLAWSFGNSRNFSSLVDNPDIVPIHET